MAPRTVLGPGYTRWCLACPEAAVAGTGGRSRTPRGGSRRARRTAIPLCNEPSSLSRHDGSHRAPHLKPCGRRGQHVAAMLSPAACSQGSRAAVAGGCRTRALWGMSCGGEARRRAMRGVLWHVRPFALAGGTACQTQVAHDPGHERAPSGRIHLETAQCIRTGLLHSLSR